MIDVTNLNDHHNATEMHSIFYRIAKALKVGLVALKLVSLRDNVGADLENVS